MGDKFSRMNILVERWRSQLKVYAGGRMRIVEDKEEVKRIINGEVDRL